MTGFGQQFLYDEICLSLARCRAQAASVERQLNLNGTKVTEGRARRVLPQHHAEDTLLVLGNVAVTPVDTHTPRKDVSVQTDAPKVKEVKEQSVQTEVPHMKDASVETASTKGIQVSVQTEAAHVKEETVQTETPKVKEETVQTETPKVKEETVQTEIPKVKEETVQTETPKVKEETVQTEEDCGEVSATREAAPEKDESASNARLLPESEVPSHRCEHLVLYLQCEECLSKVTRYEHTRIYNLTVEERRRRHATRRERVKALNADFLNDKEKARSGAKRTKPERRTSKVHFELHDLPLPIKDRELVYKAFHKSNLGVKEQWGIRLQQMNGNERAVKKEVAAMAAKRGYTLPVQVTLPDHTSPPHQ